MLSSCKERISYNKETFILAWLAGICSDLHMESEIDTLLETLAAHGYIADRPLATTLILMQHLRRPLLLEGDAGVGKTAVAQALSHIGQGQLIRMQCYEGLDSSHAVYDWNYPHQLLAIKLQEQTDQPLEDREAAIFSERFLLARPLLQAIRCERPAVLLIDEIDRADEEFEAYLLELLSDFQITIPELGTLRARSIPQVILTSNATRELSDALRRRCLYHFLDYPDLDKEMCIVRCHLPDIEQRLLQQLIRFVQGLRGLDLRKRPGIAETLDWARALIGLQVDSLARHPEIVAQTLSCLLKTRDDQQLVNAPMLAGLLEDTQA